jgi:hypothetical protein
MAGEAFFRSGHPLQGLRDLVRRRLILIAEKFDIAA